MIKTVQLKSEYLDKPFIFGRVFLLLGLGEETVNDLTNKLACGLNPYFSNFEFNKIDLTEKGKELANSDKLVFFDIDIEDNKCLDVKMRIE